MIVTDKTNKMDNLAEYMKQEFGVTPENIDRKLRELRELKELDEKLKELKEIIWKKLNRVSLEGEGCSQKLLTREKISHALKLIGTELLCKKQGGEKVELKNIRKKRGISQQQLAGAIGRDRSLIGKIENGVALPSIKTAKAIGEYLGVDWTIFF